MGTIETWDRAEAALTRALEKTGRSYEINPGDGAFYGPKLDIHVTDALERSGSARPSNWITSSLSRFDLTYVDADGSHKRPVMIHRAILGSLERFIGILVEHFAGAFPTWLAPVQAKVIPIGADHSSTRTRWPRGCAARAFGSRSTSRNEKVGYKIRDAQMQKIPYMLVVGEKEVSSGAVAVRHRSRGDLGSQEIDAFGESVLKRSGAEGLD